MSTLDLFNQDEKSLFDALMLDGEKWSARSLMKPLGYSKWENFATSIERAMATALNSGAGAAISRLQEMVPQGGVARVDYELSRFGAYLVAMNGDPRKPEVAAAQAYFAIRTREAEVAPKSLALTEDEIVAQALAITTRKVDALAQRVAELEPKAEYVNTFVTDEDVLSFSTVASTVGLQESKLRELLIDHDWIYKETASRWSRSEQRKKKVNRYTEKASKKAYFQRIENHDAPRFRGEVMHTLKITPPGAHAIAKAVVRWTNEGKDAA